MHMGRVADSRECSASDGRRRRNRCLWGRCRAIADDWNARGADRGDVGDLANRRQRQVLLLLIVIRLRTCAMHMGRVADGRQSSASD